MNPGLSLKWARVLPETEAQIGKVVVPRGWYDPNTKTIYLVPGADTVTTPKHELIHAMKDLGLIAPKQFDALVRLAHKRLKSDKRLRAVADYYDGKISDEELPQTLVSCVVVPLVIKFQVLPS